MHIEDSQVTLSASHQAIRQQTTEFSVESNFKQVFQAQVMQQTAAVTDERERVANMLQALVVAIIAAIEGKQSATKLTTDDCGPQKEARAIAEPPTFSWHCRFSQTLCESEKTTVSGRGQVKTGDGRCLDFSFGLDLQRRFDSQTIYEEAGSVVLRDPLVISFDGHSSELSEEKIVFDLNADGQQEQIPGLAAGSAYLVFDRNGNGRADDGSELFGALSGQGFNDLAQFDVDGNGWIDEADPVFSRLAVWSGQSLSTLRERGVGALYTAAVDAPFSLKTQDNQLLGEIRAAGLYLTEAGAVGALQQLDLAVSDLPLADQQPA